MAEEALILDIDIIEWEHKQRMKQLQEEVTREVTAPVSKEKNRVIGELAQKLFVLGTPEEEILRLTGLTREAPAQLLAEP